MRLLAAARRVALSAAAASCATMCTATMSAAGKFVVAVDGLASPSPETSKEFLLSRPAGAYTTARTCCSARRLFEWETHVQRTASSVAGMLGDDDDVELAKPEVLRPRLDATVAAAVREYTATHGQDGELKVTVLVTWDGAGKAPSSGAAGVGSVACHVAPLIGINDSTSVRRRKLRPLLPLVLGAANVAPRHLSDALVTDAAAVSAGQEDWPAYCSESQW